MYLQDPSFASSVYTDYMQREYFGKSELCKELEFISVYNQENFFGFPEEVKNYMDEIGDVKDVKF